jgi:hypothetical protein
MKYVLTTDHLHFFGQHHFIEFEDLLSPAEVDYLHSALDTILSKRLKVSLQTASCQDLFTQGRDLFRESEEIKKFVTRKTFAEIGSQLFNEKILRLASDRYFRSGKTSSEKVLSPSLSLQQLNCFQRISGGVLFNLYKDDLSFDLPFPLKKGSGVFLSPILKLNFSSFFTHPDSSFFLITYGPEKLIYTLSQTDPHTHDLKKWGYAFGDTMQNPTHPIVYHQ